MKQFLLKLTLFSIPIIGFAFSLEIYLRYLPNSYDIKRRLLEENASKIEILIFGTSHTYSGINPSQFKDLTVNFANNSQSLYYDMMLLNKYVDLLPKLKTVILELNFFSLRYNLDKGPENWRNRFYYQTFDIQPQTERFNILDKIRILSMTRKDLLLLIKSKNVNQKLETNLGFTRNEIHNSSISDTMAIKKYNQFKNEMINNNPKELSIMLTNILAKLHKRNINIVFVHMPLSKQLCDVIQVSDCEIENRILDTIVNNNNNIRNLDYTYSHLIDDSLFVDSDHLSYKGAKIFTDSLISHIKRLN